jgi:putative DNA primase/helicase
MDDAISLARLLIPHAQAAFALLGADAVDVDAAAILRWVQAYGLTEFTRREAQKAQEGDSGASNDYRRPSTDWNRDVVRESKRHNKGARPTTLYTVNPKALST